MRKKKLQAQRASLVKAAGDALDTALAAATAEGRALSAEETAAQKKFSADITALDELIASTPEDELQAAVTTAVLEAGPVGGPRKIEVGADRSTSKPWHAEGEIEAVGFGRWLQAVRRAMSGEGVEPRLLAGATGMGEASGPDGGWAVPVEYAAGIEKEMWETGQILSRVDARDISGNAITYNVIKETSRATGSRRGGVQGYWVDEGTAPDASKVQLAKMEMKLRKVAALGYMTDELQADAPALAQELQDAFVEELVFMVEDAVFRGSGAGQPLGFTAAPCFISVAKETGQAAATINPTNLSKMWARVPARSKANAAWLINVDAEPQLDELSLPAGTAALEPRFVTYGPDGLLRIKGRPVIPVEYAETVGTLGDITLVDLNRYRLIRKAGGVETASSIHVRFTQGENTFRAIYRVDGQPVPRAAITPFKGTNTLSPFVGLATRA
jgi:HK97 family phage major capsid protein